MFEKMLVKFHDFMVRVVGVNWRTTISGIITVLSGFILTSPEAIDFLPNAIQSYLELFAKISMIVAGGSFAILAKDKHVTGGVEAATSEAKKRIGL